MSFEENTARSTSRVIHRSATRPTRTSAKTAKWAARKTAKSARKASRRSRKTAKKTRKTQSAPLYKKTRNKIHITERGAVKIKKNGKWVYVTQAVVAGLAAIGTGGILWTLKNKDSTLSSESSKSRQEKKKEKQQYATVVDIC